MLGGVTLHGFIRWLLRRKARAAIRARGHVPVRQEYVFGRYERLWHWTMALSGLVLILTGVVVHNAGEAWPLGLATAVTLHNAFAVALMVNGFLALFHHLVTAAIRNFIPHPHGLLARVLEHVEYQSRGIFHGAPHPPPTQALQHDLRANAVLIPRRDGYDGLHVPPEGTRR